MNIIDHRAPEELQKWDKADFFLFNTIIWALTAIALMLVFIDLAIGYPSVWYFLVPLLVVNLPRLYVWHYTHKIKDGRAKSDIFYFLQDMQKMVNDNDHLRKDIEPLLITSYKLAQRGRLEPINARQQAMRQYIKENPAIESSVDDEQLENFKIMMETRREMKVQGLL